MNDAALEITVAIEHALAARGNAARRDFLSGGYAPSRLHGCGASVPEIRQVVREFSRRLKSAPPARIVRIALMLVKRGTLEGRQVGYELIARRKDAMARLTPSLIERLGRGNDNWASVDGFCAFITGRAWREALIHDRDVRRWARSSDRWWRRTALASTVPLNITARGGAGDVRRTLAICRYFVGERDPMLAKALSWALRSAASHDAAAVRGFLLKYKDRLPSIVRREVSTKLATM